MVPYVTEASLFVEIASATSRVESVFSSVVYKRPSPISTRSSVFPLLGSVGNPMTYVGLGCMRGTTKIYSRKRTNTAQKLKKIFFTNKQPPLSEVYFIDISHDFFKIIMSLFGRMCKTCVKHFNHRLFIDIFT